MPGIEDWVNNPLEIISTLFDVNPEAYASKVREYFSARTKDKASRLRIPSLNDTPLHNLCTNTLVRFRCMIQDMYDPEYYLGLYEVEDLKTGQRLMRSGMFRDLAECTAHQDIKLESTRNVTMDRQTLYCVPVPGENDWVKQIPSFADQCPSSALPSTSSGSLGTKRSLEDEDDTVLPPGGTEMEMSKADGATNGDVSMTATGDKQTDTKRSRVNAQHGRSGPVTPDLNFPLPNEPGPACIMKIYHNADKFKVNDVVEFIGVLSNDPAMATFPERKRPDSSVAAVDVMDGVEEGDAQSPPPSLVPRIHVIVTRDCLHGNPLIPDESQSHNSGLQEDVLSLRDQLLAVLEQAVFGDRLSAEYLLCHLISSVYSRQDIVAVGKFSLNLLGLPTPSPTPSHFPQQLYDLLESLVTKSFYLPMTLDNMNKLRFCPKKDYSANRLRSGLLQLSDHTHLVVDETALQPGQLDTNGVQNITALGNLVTWQKVEYDFDFHKQDFPCDIITLVLSEGKSILKCDCQVRVTPRLSTSLAEVEKRFEGIHTFLTPTLLTRLRTFLSLVRQVPYHVSSDLQKEIEEDFVSTRKEDTRKMTIDDFHSLLVLTRLLCLSHGRSEPTKDVWDTAKSMEAERKLRLGAQSTVTS